MNRLLSYPTSTVGFPETLQLSRLTHAQDRRFKIKVTTPGKKRRGEQSVFPMCAPLSSKCYVFDWQTVLILPHPPIAGLDSHAEHQQWWERFKKQGHSKNSRILAVCTHLSHRKMAHCKKCPISVQQYLCYSLLYDIKVNIYHLLYPRLFSFDFYSLTSSKALY